MRSSSLAAVAAAAAVLPLGGCNAILGITDVPTPELVDAGGDATAQAEPDATVADGAPPDAVTERVDGEGGECGDTTSDPQNCGRCRHDCLGGGCANSACQPFALVPPDAGSTPVQLAIDDAYVYWTDDTLSAVWRTDKGTGATSALAQGTFDPDPIALDDAGVYWGDTAGVYRCPKTGCSVAGAAIVAQGYSADGTVPRAIFSLALDATNVYFGEGDIDLLSAPKDGANVAPTVLWEFDASAYEADDAAVPVIGHVATDGQRVYFTATDGFVRGVTVDGGAPVATGAASPFGTNDVILGADSLYWSVPDPANGLIATASTVTLDAGVFAGEQTAPTALASDGMNLYWVRASDAGSTTAIVTCALASCQPTVLAAGYQQALSIVVDPTAVYWTEYGAGTPGARGAVWKLAK